MRTEKKSAYKTQTWRIPSEEVKGITGRSTGCSALEKEALPDVLLTAYDDHELRLQQTSLLYLEPPEC